MPFAPALAIVDVETTGTSPVHARMTEIAIIRVDTPAGNDEPKVERWSTLLRPERPIPPEIRFLTGIDDAMVANAPRFAEVADRIAALLDGAVFVAHHARFDYGFVKREFARTGRAFHARTLCTVRLSRLLDPDRDAHSLDALAIRHRLPAAGRHRAAGDAEILWAFLRHIVATRGLQTLRAAAQRLLPHPSIPAHLPPDLLSRVPDAPGIYRFVGETGQPLYIGKSRCLRDRIAQHFCNDVHSERGLRLAIETRAVDWETSVGDFGACLREIDAIAREMPAHNRALRRRENACVIAMRDDDPRPDFVATETLAAPALAGHFGPFASRAAARRWLLGQARERHWCLRAMGLEPGAAGAPCFNRQIGRCTGTCVGAEPGSALASRIVAALAERRLPAWPEHAFALRERPAGHAATELAHREAWHVFEHGCWLGSAPDEARALALACSDVPRRFDPAVHALLARALGPRPAREWRLEWRALDAAGPAQRPENSQSSA